MTLRERSRTRIYAVPGDLVVRRSLVDREAIHICWGAGPDRQVLTTTSPALAAWILEVAAAPLEALVASAAAALGIAQAEAEGIVDRLRGRGLLRAGTVTREAERQWLACNLYDALSFHRATRNASPQEARQVDEDGHAVSADDAPSAAHLPPPSDLLRQTEFFRTLHWRRTTRNFTGTQISLQQVSDVLWWSTRAPVHAFTMFAVFDREKAPAELPADAPAFRYDADRHALVPTGSGAPPGRLAELLSEQDFVNGAPVMLVLAINWSHYMHSRSPHLYSVAHHEAGAFMQRTLLIATALGLRTFITAALDDLRFEALLETDDSVLAPTYIVALGSPRWQRGGIV